VTTPEVSILLVTHNHENFVADALDDVAAQVTDRSVEIVIADDASSDGTRDMLERWERDVDLTVNLLAPREHLGITANYERGFAACRGRYVAVLEGDDRWIDVSKIETLASLLDSDESLSFAFNRCLVWFEEEHTGFVRTELGLDALQQTFSRHQLAEGNFIATFSACMYRGALLNRLDAKIFSTIAYDWLVNLAMARFGPIGLVPRVMTVYRVHADGAWSSLSQAMQREQLSELISEYDEVLGGEVTRELARQQRSLISAIEATGTPAAGSSASDATALGSGAPIAPIAQSVLDQSMGDLELIVVDDGSSDETAKRVANLSDERVRFFRLYPNRGACAAMNLALQQADGELVAVINSDDVWEGSKLERQLGVLDDDPELDAVFTGARLISDVGRPLRLKELPEWHAVFRQPNRSPGQWLRKFWIYGNCLCHPSAVMRRSVFEHLGLYDNRFRQLPDLDLWIKLAKHSRFTVLGDEALVRFRVFRSHTNASSNAPHNVARTVHEHLMLCRTFFEGCSPRTFRDGFADLFVDPMSETNEELECEQALLWMSDEPRLSPIYRFHGIGELFRLLQLPSHRDLLRHRYGVDELRLHELAGGLASERDRAMLDPSGWLAPAFARSTAVPSGDLARELVGRLRQRPLRHWPRLVARQLRTRR
jgi:glycosyltransferase involved in cell wall biosynthesis